MKKFEYWEQHFSSNRPFVNWKETHILSETERKAISNALQVFQKGESSEAKNLKQKAKMWVANKYDDSYYPALVAFISEENRHSRELGEFMDIHGIPRLEAHWEDGLFRGMRRWVNLEGSIVILLTAEIMACEFYQALFHCTKSPVLKQICTNILIDEDQHIVFQSHGLSQFYADRGFMFRAVAHVSRLILLLGSIVLVWNLHRRIFKKSGYTFGSFFSGSIATYERTVSIIEALVAQEKYKEKDLSIKTATLYEH